MGGAPAPPSSWTSAQRIAPARACPPAGRALQLRRVGASVAGTPCQMPACRQCHRIRRSWLLFANLGQHMAQHSEYWLMSAKVWPVLTEICQRVPNPPTCGRSLAAVCQRWQRSGPIPAREEAEIGPDLGSPINLMSVVQQLLAIVGRHRSSPRGPGTFLLRVASSCAVRVDRSPLPPASYPKPPAAGAIPWVLGAALRPPPDRLGPSCCMASLHARGALERQSPRGECRRIGRRASRLQGMRHSGLFLGAGQTAATSRGLRCRQLRNRCSGCTDEPASCSTARCAT